MIKENEGIVVKLRTGIGGKSRPIKDSRRARVTELGGKGQGEIGISLMCRELGT